MPFAEFEVKRIGCDDVEGGGKKISCVVIWKWRCCWWCGGNGLKVKKSLFPTTAM